MPEVSVSATWEDRVSAGFKSLATNVRQGAQEATTGTQRLGASADAAAVQLRRNSEALQVAGRTALQAAAAFGVGTIGISQLSAVLSSSFREYVQNEQGLKRLEVAARLAGQGFAPGAAREWADSLERATSVSDAAILRARALGVNLGLTAAQSKKATEAALELSAVTGQDLDAAMTQLAATINGQVMKELGRVAPELRSMSREALASGAAFDTVLKKFAGTAASIKDPLADLKTEIGNLQEAIGRLGASSISGDKGAGGVLKNISTNVDLMTKAVEAAKAAGVPGFLAGILGNVGAVGITSLQAIGLAHVTTREGTSSVPAGSAEDPGAALLRKRLEAVSDAARELEQSMHDPAEIFKELASQFPVVQAEKMAEEIVRAGGSVADAHRRVAAAQNALEQSVKSQQEASDALAEMQRRIAGSFEKERLGNVIGRRDIGRADLLEFGFGETERGGTMPKDRELEQLLEGVDKYYTEAQKGEDELLKKTLERYNEEMRLVDSLGDVIADVFDGVIRGEKAGDILKDILDGVSKQLLHGLNLTDQLAAIARRIFEGGPKKNKPGFFGDLEGFVSLITGGNTLVDWAINELADLGDTRRSTIGPASSSLWELDRMQRTALALAPSVWTPALTSAAPSGIDYEKLGNAVAVAVRSELKAHIAASPEIPDAQLTRSMARLLLNEQSIAAARGLR